MKFVLINKNPSIKVEDNPCEISAFELTRPMEKQGESGTKSGVMHAGLGVYRVAGNAGNRFWGNEPCNR